MHFQKKESLFGKESDLKLFLIHTGYYDRENSDGFYEQHTNILIVAKNIVDARDKIKKNVEFINKKMHIDGIKEINIIDGYQIKPIKSNEEKMDVKTYTHQ